MVRHDYDNFYEPIDGEDPPKPPVGPTRFRSSRRDDFIEWVGCPSVRQSVHPSVNNSSFFISSLITWPTKLKLCRMILDIIYSTGRFYTFFDQGCAPYGRRAEGDRPQISGVGTGGEAEVATASRRLWGHLAPRCGEMPVIPYTMSWLVVASLAVVDWGHPLRLLTVIWIHLLDGPSVFILQILKDDVLLVTFLTEKQLLFFILFFLNLWNTECISILD